MFRDKRILITGASSGLGLALSLALAERGAKLAIVARNPEKLSVATQLIRARNPQANVAVIALDVAEPGAADAIARAAVSGLGGIDMLVNNAGILKEGYFEALRPSDFQAITDINFHAAVDLVRACLPSLRKSSGRIINIASVAGLTGTFGYTAYSAAKHALVGFTRSLQFELPLQGISVQLVCPAEFDSPMVDALDQTRTAENRAHTLTIPKVSVDVVVKAVLKGIESGRAEIVPGAATQLAVLGLRLFPGLSRRIGVNKVRDAVSANRRSRR